MSAIWSDGVYRNYTGIDNRNVRGRAFSFIPRKDVSSDALKEQKGALHKDEPEKGRCQHSTIITEHLQVDEIGIAISQPRRHFTTAGLV